MDQHFLVDGSVLGHILAAAELSPADLVIEVGPGLGTLTQALAQRAGHVVAVEKDAHLSGMLRQTLASSSNVTIVNSIFYGWQGIQARREGIALDLGVEDRDFCKRLVDWADIIRKTFYDGGIEEIISTRRLVHIVRAYSIFND
jgi:hypothetical protein